MKKWLIGCFIAFIVGIGIYIFLGWKINQYAVTTADGSNDTMVILGAKVKANGVPSLSLKNRLDVAIDYLNEYPHVQVVVTGGQGHDEDQTEASAMYTYLVSHGIDGERIILEELSTSTYENLLFTKKLLGDEWTHATIVSNDFHLARATYLASKLNIEIDTIAAPTPKVVEAKSRFRERLALLKTYVVGH